MNVTAIASSPRTSTGPPFERLYAVEPDGVEQIIPSQGTTPRSSPRDRPAELDHPAERRARRDDVVDGDERLAVQLRLERRQLDRPVLAGEDAREVVLEPLRRRSRRGSRRARS